MVGDSVMCYDLALNIEPEPLRARRRDCCPGAASPSNSPSIHV